MNFDHEELTLMMLYNTGTRLGLIHELRLMQCYLMPDEKMCIRDSCDTDRYRAFRAENRAARQVGVLY